MPYDIYAQLSYVELLGLNDIFCNQYFKKCI